MLLPTHKIREIIEEAQFRDELSEFENDPARADEFIEGAKMLLSRAPDMGTKIGRRVWYLPMRGFTQNPLILYYTFDENRVFFLSLQSADTDISE
jgi:hypothetical protein